MQGNLNIQRVKRPFIKLKYERGPLVQVHRVQLLMQIESGGKLQINLIKYAQ